MREIKFRYWDTDINKMLYLVDGFLPSTITTLYPIMQYTGLKDKNGTEIYESDIAKTKGHILKEDEEEFNCVVEFRDFSWQLVGDGRYCITKPCEVIGNIYENPELLEK